MSATLAHFVTALAPEGLQINIWPTETGYQANVKERAGKGWTCTSNADPVTALERALSQRAVRLPNREVVADDPPPVELVAEPTTDPRQIDLEEVIASTTDDDDFGDLLG